MRKGTSWAASIGNKPTMAPKSSTPSYIATGGHMDYGESVSDALRREVGEELGVTDFNERFICKYVFESKRERELVYVFATTYDGIVSPNPGELAGGRFFSKDEIKEKMGKDFFTPNFEEEYMRIFGK